MADDRAVFLLVHGSWHVPQHWAPFSTELESLGYECIIPHLPSSSNDRPARSKLSDDVRAIETALQPYLDQSRRIVVIAHSMGGLAATEAMRDHSTTIRKLRGLRGGVSHFIYVCAVLLQAGESIKTTRASAGTSPQLNPIIDPDPDGTCFITRPGREIFYPDVSQDWADAAEALLVRYCTGVFAEKLTYEAWRDIPSTYILCTKDAALSQERQKGFVDAVNGDGGRVEILTYQSGHTPFLSMMPTMLADVVRIAHVPAS